MSRAGGFSLVACAALTVTGCGMGDDVMATIGMPASETTSAGTIAATYGQPPARDPADGPDLVVTPPQQAYLDALGREGVHAGSELSALSIGAYVCQAKAAKQSDQEVWDFVLPMVREDVRDSHPDYEALPAGEVNSVTADYIRIANDKLC